MVVVGRWVEVSVSVDKNKLGDRQIYTKKKSIILSNRR